MSSPFLRIIVALGLILTSCGADMRPASGAGLTALRAWLALPAGQRSAESASLRLPLTRAAAAAALVLLAADRRAQAADRWRQAIAARAITVGDWTLRWETRVYGAVPTGGHSLWISLHGGGVAPADARDEPPRNRIGLYRPAEGISLALRAPAATRSLWREGRLDPLIQALIDAEVAVDGVNPDHVYLLGYSAGGDGVWQVAPRMADRFAAAATMAGPPRDASLLPLRNLPFALFVSGEDAAHGRDHGARQRATQLAALRASDPGGYTFLARIHPGLPYGNDRRDAEAVPWMAQFTRDPWPRRVVWVQDDVAHDRFYWLQLADGSLARAGQRIVATLVGQEIAIAGEVPSGLTLRLSDRLVDLDRPIRVTVNGRLAFHGRVTRTADAIEQSLRARDDPASAATARLRVN